MISSNKTRKGVLSTVGNTPLVPLTALFRENDIKVFGKMESLNPGGSIKDRTANTIIYEALRKGEINEGDTVIESSSGNMGIGLAQACLKLRLNFIVVVDPLVNRQTLKILQAYGARVEMVEEKDQNGGYLNTRLSRVQHLLDEIPGSYWPNQYANQANPMAHRGTMKEIVRELPGDVDYLFAATSTCGTIMGCSQYLRELRLKTKIVAVDAEGSVLFGQEPSDRLIPGHGAGRPSELLDSRYLDKVIHVNDRESVVGCHELLRREAILAGGSSGAVITAVHKMLPEIPDGSKCVVILCDRGERYLDTIYSEEWIRNHFGEISLKWEEEKEKEAVYI